MGFINNLSGKEVNKDQYLQSIDHAQVNTYNNKSSFFNRVKKLKTSISNTLSNLISSKNITIKPSHITKTTSTFVSNNQSNNVLSDLVDLVKEVNGIMRKTAHNLNQYNEIEPQLDLSKAYLDDIKSLDKTIRPSDIRMLKGASEPLRDHINNNPSPSYSEMIAFDGGLQQILPTLNKYLNSVFSYLFMDNIDTKSDEYLELDEDKKNVIAYDQLNFSKAFFNSLVSNISEIDNRPESVLAKKISRNIAILEKNLHSDKLLDIQMNMARNTLNELYKFSRKGEELIFGNGNNIKILMSLNDNLSASINGGFRG